MLGGRDDRVLLDPVDDRRGRAAGEERVLAVVLPSSAVERIAEDVDPRAQQDVHALGKGLPTQLPAVRTQQRQVPSGGLGDAVGERGGTDLRVPDPGRRVVEDERGDAQSRVREHDARRSVVRVARVGRCGVAGDEIDLVRERHRA